MFHTPTIVVNSTPPHQEDSVLGSASESRLGRIMEAATLAPLRRADAAIRKKRHADRLQAFLALRADAAKRCQEAVLGTVPLSIPKQVVTEQPNEQPKRPDWWTRLPDRPISPINDHRHVVYQVTFAPKGQGLHGRNNWCPVCKEYVAMSHDGPKGIVCEEYIKQRAQREAEHVAWLRTQTNPVIYGVSVLPNSAKQIKGKLVLSKKRNEARMVAPIDQCYAVIKQKLKAGQSATTIARELGVSRCRVLQLQKRFLVTARLKAGQSPRFIARDLGNLVVYGVFGITPEDYVNNLKKCLHKLSQTQVDGQAVKQPTPSRKPKRHYVRHSVSFVRQQDLNLATNI